MWIHVGKPQSERNSGSGRLVLVAGGLLLLAPGCFTGGVGEVCSGENDCPFGLRCYAPSAGTTKICTTLCSGEACPGKGICLKTSDGDVCSKECKSAADCGTGLGRD